MVRVISNRGMGKTSALLSAAISYAGANPDENVFFATLNTKETERKVAWAYKAPKNFKVISHNSVLGKMSNKNNKVFIDELDIFLRELSVEGYSTTIGE